jgi:transposase, IS5 family
VPVDTTVQSNSVIFPTDAELLHAAIKGAQSSGQRGLRLRQLNLLSPRKPRQWRGPISMPSSSSATIGDRACSAAGPARIIRDIQRKIAKQAELEVPSRAPLTRAQRGQKLYSFDAD